MQCLGGGEVADVDVTRTKYIKQKHTQKKNTPTHDASDVSSLPATAPHGSGPLPELVSASADAGAAEQDKGKRGTYDDGGARKASRLARRMLRERNRVDAAGWTVGPATMLRAAARPG